MSRLIDADDFKKFLQALCKAGAPYEEVVELLDKQPTAFDTEKVVEQLNNVLQDLNVIEILSQFDPDSTIQTSLDRFLNANRNEVLNIVKKGGVE